MLHVTETGGKDVDYAIGHVKYEDGLMVGYRYWTTGGKHPLFPFGFGLSYTTFSYSDLKLDKQKLTSGGKITVSVT